MKLYNADLRYSLLGAAWQIILRGTEKHIKEAFNSLYNHEATHGELTWVSKNDPYCMATFWSSRSKMFQYFYNRHKFQHDSHNYATAHAASMMNALMSGENSEPFKRNEKPYTDGFSVGCLNDETPDIHVKDDKIIRFPKQQKEEETEEQNSVEENKIIPFPQAPPKPMEVLVAEF